VRLLLDRGLNVLQYACAGLHTAEMKGAWDILSLLKSRGATLAALSDDDKEKWAEENGDGTKRAINNRIFISYDEVLEPDDEPENLEEQEEEEEEETNTAGGGELSHFLWMLLLHTGTQSETGS